MFGAIAARVAGFVTDHDLLVIGVVLLLTVGVGAGLPQLDTEDQTQIDDDVFSATEVGESLDYMDQHYEASGGDDGVARSSVYYRPEEGNALSRSSLLAVLDFQRAVLDDPAVAGELAGENPVDGPPTRVATVLAGEGASLAEQRAALEEASDRELRRAVERSFADPRTAGKFLPRSYDPGSSSAESLRIRIAFEQASVTQQQEPLPAESAQQVLYESAQEGEDFFTMGTFAQAEWEQQQISDVIWLIIPPALLVVLGVLAFTYRDLVDVLLGFVGVCVSVVWFFGILGWLGIPAGFASIVGPVLIVALSIDFGLHVFMRYREQREGGDDIQRSMARSTSSVVVAFTLVAITAGVGFLANVTSPIGFIRAFGVVITLGVVAAAFIFVTLVPALKVRIDETLEGFGFDREKPALGSGDLLNPALRVGVDLARRGGLVVIVLALLVAAVGAFTYTEIDRQGFQEGFTDADDWQTDLPGPMGWSAHETEYRQNLGYVQSNFQADVERDRATAFLVRGDVTDVEALRRIQAGTRAANTSDLTFKQDGEVPAVSPLTVIEDVAGEDPAVAGAVASVRDGNEAFDRLIARLEAENEEFAASLASASGAPRTLDTEGGDLTTVYDALYERAPEEAARVIERRDGAYRSIRLIVPVQQGLDVNDQGEEMHGIAAETAGESDLSVVPVGFATVSNAGLGEIADSILETMLLAFAGVALVLAGTYKLERGSASLGAVTVVPIALVIGLVFGGMYLFGVPLTFVTAFLASITVGLGIDYNIHISDRFAQELADGLDPVPALNETVTGTGGALLGSALTSGAAFATLLMHPSPVFQSFGFIVVVALLLSFGVSVLVFPSLLLLWARRADV